ncbi:MAG: Lsr2 family protein, partial [Cellulomonadaceae bacterium]|nr:Lsr2 family protein [Cellulomonadaceae bacterium]
EGAATYRFSWQGTAYEVDLTEEHRDEFLRVLQPYITAARRPAPGVARADARLDRVQSAQVRAWAAANGHHVSDRGRIPARVTEAYENRR